MFYEGLLFEGNCVNVSQTCVFGLSSKSTNALSFVYLDVLRFFSADLVMLALIFWLTRFSSEFVWYVCLLHGGFFPTFRVFTDNSASPECWGKR